MTNVLLVTIDCLRADHVSAFGYHRDTTPALDALAGRGARSLCLANHPGTRWAMQSLMAGVYTLQIDGVGIPSEAETLPEQFEAADYATAGYANNAFLTHLYGYDRGFDVFQGGMKFDRATQTDETTVTRATSWIDGVQSSDRSWFGWVHLMDAHGPWEPHWSLRSEMGLDMDVEHVERAHDHVTPGEDPPQPVIDAYDAGVRSADEQLGNLVDAVADDTLIVVTGDHGEEFGEHHEYHTASLHETMTDVPLVVNRGRLNAGAHQHVDVPPIILDRAGLDQPDSWVGAASPTNFDDPAFLAVREEVGAEESSGDRYVKNVETGEAIVETDNDGDHELAEGFVDGMVSWCADTHLGAAMSGKQDELSDQTLSRLRQLGYMQGGQR